MYIDLKNINTSNFNRIALESFRYQYQSVQIYRKFCDGIQKTIQNVHNIEDIPFLPISFFKTHRVHADQLTDFELRFESSGTKGQVLSNHYVLDASLYHSSIDLGFDHFFGSNNTYQIFGLLPHYLERNHSSLVYMVNRWMDQSKYQEKNFYLYNISELIGAINKAIQYEEKIILIGISFAMLDLCHSFSTNYDNIFIIETGGMKGKYPEMPKEVLWNNIRRSFPNAKIGSEYGMCELLSQAFAFGEHKFLTPSWMKLMVSELNDPLTTRSNGIGVAKVIDLANINSCSFIETEDIVDISLDGSFKIMGRKDHSDVRGCSLMY